MPAEPPDRQPPATCSRRTSASRRARRARSPAARTSWSRSPASSGRSPSGCSTCRGSTSSAASRSSPARLVLGARTTYTEIRRSTLCREHLPALVEAAATIGAAQIQNRGTLGGNIANASPAGDTLPILLAADAVILVGGQRGEREIAAADFFVEYRKTALAPDELILQVRFPLVRGRELRFRKVGTRRAQAISKVVMALAWHDRRRLVRRPRRRSAPSRRRRSAPAPPRPSSRAPARTPRWRIAPPRRSRASSSRSTTSARRPTTGGPSRPGSCTACSGTPAAGERAARRRLADGMASEPFAPDAMTAREFTAAMAPLFEGAPGFLWRLAAARPFGSAERLFERARELAHAMPEPHQVELVDAHPRLGAPPGVGLRDVVPGAGLRPSRQRRISRPRRHGSGTASRPSWTASTASTRARSASATVSSWPADPVPSSCPRWRRRSLGSEIRSSTARSMRSSTSPRTATGRGRRVTLRARREPLRQVAHPARHRSARPGAARPPGPDRRRRARGRLRRGPHGRRQRRGHRHGHDEEHRLRVRPRSADRLARGVRARARPALRRLPGRRAGDRRHRGARLAADPGRGRRGARTRSSGRAT